MKYHIRYVALRLWLSIMRFAWTSLHLDPFGDSLCSLICVAVSHSMLFEGWGDRSRSLFSVLSRRVLYLMTFFLHSSIASLSCLLMSCKMDEFGRLSKSSCSRISLSVWFGSICSPCDFSFMNLRYSSRADGGDDGYMFLVAFMDAG